MPETCSLCQGRGYLVYDVAPGHERFGKLVACRCTLAGKRAALFTGALAEMTLDSFKPLTAAERAAKKVAKATASAWLTPGGTPRSLIFYAPLQNVMQVFPGHEKALHVTGAGCGKTHLAVSLGKVALDAGRDVKFTTETELLRAIKRSYDDETAPREAALLADLGQAWLLILDDVGTVGVKSAEWYQDIIFAIVNQRYNAGLPLIVTSNLAPAELAGRVGVRAWSRLNGMAEICHLDGPDRREMR